MIKKQQNESTDELSPTLRKALIECGAIIPTAEDEVLLAERQHKVKLTRAEVEAAFKQLENALDDPGNDITFARPSESLLALNREDLAMAARNGAELDDETRAKVDASVEKALRKPPQGS
jgi:hypothetical protein